MTGMPLSPELCGHIASFMQPEHKDLIALCLTCKAFQRGAEIRLYESLAFVEPHRLHMACKTIVHNERLALLVRNFIFNHDVRRPPPLGQPFWAAVKEALNNMHNLEYLVLYDSTCSNTWIFNATEIKFQLHDAKLRFAWDLRMIEFLRNQRKLKGLQILDRQSDLDRPELEPGSLSMLRTFDGTIMLSMQLLSCPLTHLQIHITDDTAPHVSIVLPELVHLHKTLRSLSILDLQEDETADALATVSSVCPTIRHLGLLPLPTTNRHEIYHSLMHMHNLRAIQIDLTRWSPQPQVPAQRSLAAEIRLYCPTIRCVVFWVPGSRFRWTSNGHEWRSQVDTHQYPSLDSMWYLM